MTPSDETPTHHPAPTTPNDEPRTQPPSTTSSTIPTLKSKASYLQAIAHDGVTVLEATAPWCTQCRTIAPEMAKMVREYPAVRFFTYDVEACEDVAQELGVSRVPSFSMFKGGEFQGGVTGARVAEVRRGVEGCL